MKIRLIASDLDGTLLTDDKKITENTRKAIGMAVEKGVFFVPATGRSFSAVPKEVLELPGVEYVITSNGAAIYSWDGKAGRRVWECVLERESADLLLSMKRPGNTALEVFVEGVPYAHESYVRDPAAYGATAFGVGYVKRTRRPVADIEAFARENLHRLDSLDFICCQNEELEAFHQQIEREVPHIYVTSSMAHRLEISHVRTGKGNALSWLLGKLEVSADQAMAFGDADNDIPMLAAVSYGVAVENAQEACRQAAWEVAPSNGADGVARTIWKYL
ncbi:MAG: Cof-type HAD-IIB family hydrolase [Eubacteriales bacterium]|nr:Cof-type HAD-IIB family hydrolase [Eubacteriales bacterium]